MEYSVCKPSRHLQNIGDNLGMRVWDLVFGAEGLTVFFDVLVYSFVCAPVENVRYAGFS